MTIEANDLLLFARVVDEGSFSRAAERLELPKSTVSRRIAALEAQLGERLLLRTTRKLTVTDFGHSVLEHARQVADEVERRRVAGAKPAGRAERAAARVDAGRPRQLACSGRCSPTSSRAIRRSRSRWICRRASST